MTLRKHIITYALIAAGSLLYAAATVLFIFPHSLLLGGTSGISVILEAYLPFSPGMILTVINFALLILAFIVLGRDMAVKTTVGSVLTTLAVALLEKPLTFEAPIIANQFISAVTGAAIIAVASGVMFYVDSSSGGTDIVALIVRKFSNINVGRALFYTDIAIVAVGGIIAGLPILISSVAGLLVKTTGIDTVIGTIKMKLRKQ